jgi:hypothetical protein
LLLVRAHLEKIFKIDIARRDIVMIDSIRGGRRGDLDQLLLQARQRRRKAAQAFLVRLGDRIETRIFPCASQKMGLGM